MEDSWKKHETRIISVLLSYHAFAVFSSYCISFYYTCVHRSEYASHFSPISHEAELIDG